jgi:hypothetical protein
MTVVINTGEITHCAKPLFVEEQAVKPEIVDILL